MLHMVVLDTNDGQRKAQICTLSNIRIPLDIMYPHTNWAAYTCRTPCIRILIFVDSCVKWPKRNSPKRLFYWLEEGIETPGKRLSTRM